MVGTFMIEHCNIQIVHGSIILFYNLLTTFEQSVIPFHLNKPHRSHDVRHIALIPWSNDVILPST